MYELAIDDLSMAKALAPNSQFKPLCRRAQACLAAGRPDDAIEDARLAIQLAANDGPAYLALGSGILSSPKEKPDRAIEYLKYAMRIDNKLAPLANARLAEAYFDVGVGLAKEGKEANAEHAFREAEGRDLKYVQLVRDFKDKAGMPEKSGGLSRETGLNGPAFVPKPDPKLVERFQHALELVHKGQSDKKLDEAIAELTDIVRSDPNYAREHGGSAVGRSLKKRSRTRPFTTSTKPLRWDPRSVDAYSQRA